jgi:hypothetical protein
MASPLAQENPMPVHSTLSDWKNAKAQAKKVGLNIAVFKDDLSSAYDKILKEEQNLQAARKAYLAETETFLKIIAKYKKISEGYVEDTYKAMGPQGVAARDLAGTCSSLESWAQQIRKSLK